MKADIVSEKDGKTHVTFEATEKEMRLLVKGIVALASKKPKRRKPSRRLL